MPAPLVTSAINHGSALGSTLALGPVTVKLGDLVVAVFADMVGGSAPTIGDNLSNSWTALAGPTTNTIRLSAWFTVVTVAGALTATITFGSVALTRAGVLGLFRIVPGAPLDLNPANANDSTSPYVCPSSGTLTQTDETVIGYGALAGAGTDTLAAVAPDLLVASDGTSLGAADATAIMTYRTVKLSTSIAPSFTDTTSNRTGVVGTAAFMAVPYISSWPATFSSGLELAGANCMVASGPMTGGKL